MEPREKNIQRLLPSGAVSVAAKKPSILITTISKALKTEKPVIPSVQEDLLMAQKSGTLVATKTLAFLTA